VSHEDRLKAVLRRIRRSRRARPPISLTPTSAFEAVVLERINALQSDVARLQDQNKWLLRLVAGAIIAALLDLLTR